MPQFLSQIGVVDLILGVVLLLFALHGLWYGFVRELFALLALVGGWFAATRYHLGVVRFFGIEETGGVATRVLVFIGLFLLVVLVVRLIGKALNKVLSESPLGWIDRLAGGACGLLVGTVFLGVVLLLVTTYVPRFQPFFMQSELYAPLTTVVRVMAEVLPEEVHKLYERHLVGSGSASIPPKGVI
jgi:membrane protein required for colicin V production